MGADVILTSDLNVVHRVLSGVGVIECPNPECRRYVQVPAGRVAVHRTLGPMSGPECPVSGVAVVDDAV
ncbi:hypothetical protein [Peterkaempfera sp. SMS 1(5)a]|uniref:hypothetical protein n=1 Tax=Peterkaempfera podocarpi TaxID=3232308 RepID=UPI0036719621